MRYARSRFPRAEVMLAAVACVVLMGQGKAKELPDLEVRSLTVKSKGGKELAFLAHTCPRQPSSCARVMGSEGATSL